MSEKRQLTHRIEVHLPEVESTTAVRFCPNCGKKIPNNRTICEQCETGKFRKEKQNNNCNVTIFDQIFGRRDLLIAWAILCGLFLVILLVICVDVPGVDLLTTSIPQPVYSPVGTLVPVILLVP